MEVEEVRNNLIKVRNIIEEKLEISNNPVYVDYWKQATDLLDQLDDIPIKKKEPSIDEDTKKAQLEALQQSLEAVKIIAFKKMKVSNNPSYKFYYTHANDLLDEIEEIKKSQKGKSIIGKVGNLVSGAVAGAAGAVGGAISGAAGTVRDTVKTVAEKTAEIVKKPFEWVGDYLKQIITKDNVNFGALTLDDLEVLEKQTREKLKDPSVSATNKKNIAQNLNRISKLKNDKIVELAADSPVMRAYKEQNDELEKEMKKIRLQREEAERKRLEEERKAEERKRKEAEEKKRLEEEKIRLEEEKKRKEEEERRAAEELALKQKEALKDKVKGVFNFLKTLANEKHFKQNGDTLEIDYANMSWDDRWKLHNQLSIRKFPDEETNSFAQKLCKYMASHNNNQPVETVKQSYLEDCHKLGLEIKLNLIKSQETIQKELQEKRAAELKRKQEEEEKAKKLAEEERLRKEYERKQTEEAERKRIEEEERKRKEEEERLRKEEEERKRKEEEERLRKEAEEAERKLKEEDETENKRIDQELEEEDKQLKLKEQEKRKQKEEEEKRKAEKEEKIHDFYKDLFNRIKEQISNKNAIAVDNNLYIIGLGEIHPEESPKIYNSFVQDSSIMNKYSEKLKKILTDFLDVIRCISPDEYSKFFEKLDTLKTSMRALHPEIGFYFGDEQYLNKYYAALTDYLNKHIEDIQNKQKQWYNNQAKVRELDLEEQKQIAAEKNEDVEELTNTSFMLDTMIDEFQEYLPEYKEQIVKNGRHYYIYLSRIPQKEIKKKYNEIEEYVDTLWDESGSYDIDFSCKNYMLNVLKNYSQNNIKAALANLEKLRENCGNTDYKIIIQLDEANAPKNVIEEDSINKEEITKIYQVIHYTVPNYTTEPGDNMYIYLSDASGEQLRQLADQIRSQKMKNLAGKNVKLQKYFTYLGNIIDEMKYVQPDYDKINEWKKEYEQLVKEVGIKINLITYPMSRIYLDELMNTLSNIQGEDKIFVKGKNNFWTVYMNKCQPYMANNFATAIKASRNSRFEKVAKNSYYTSFDETLEKYFKLAARNRSIRYSYIEKQLFGLIKSIDLKLYFNY